MSEEKGSFFPCISVSEGAHNITPVNSSLTGQNCCVCPFLSWEKDGITLLDLNQPRLTLEGQEGASLPDTHDNQMPEQNWGSVSKKEREWPIDRPLIITTTVTKVF